MTAARKKYFPSQQNLRQRFIKQKRRNVLAREGPKKFIIVLDGLKPNFNIGKIFRSGYALGVRRIHLVNIELFDPAPAKGAFRSVPAVFEESFAACYKKLVEEEYTVFIFSPKSERSLQTMKLPEKSAFVFGHEEFGFSFDSEAYPNLQRIHIEQTGKMDSLNVSVAASIAMYEYGRQHSLNKLPNEKSHPLQMK